MKALVKDIDGVGLTLREVKKPTIQANEVLIKIKSTAICGTDLHIWNWDAWAMAQASQFQICRSVPHIAVDLIFIKTSFA